MVLDAQGWRILLEPIDRQRRATLPFLLWVAAVREAIGRLLPAAGIGGEMVGIRLTRLRLDDTTAVAATVIVEILITLYLRSCAGVSRAQPPTVQQDHRALVAAADKIGRE